MPSSPDDKSNPQLRDVVPGSDADTTPAAMQPHGSSAPLPQDGEHGIDMKAEVHFLADEFGIAPTQGAALVASDEDAALTLAAEVMAEELERDPLAGVPVPDPKKDPAHLERDVSDLEKPVVHEESAPT